MLKLIETELRMQWQKSQKNQNQPEQEKVILDNFKLIQKSEE